MYVYVYLFCNCVKTSEILLECALQVYCKFGWICKIASLSVWLYLCHRRVATVLAHRDFLILRLMKTPAYLFTEELLVDNIYDYFINKTCKLQTEVITV